MFNFSFIFNPCNSSFIVYKLNSDLSRRIKCFGFIFIICLHNSLPIDPPAPVTKTFLFSIFRF